MYRTKEIEQARVNDSVNVVAKRLLRDIKRLSESPDLEIPARTEREAITDALLKALHIWSRNSNGPEGHESQQQICENGPAQTRSPNCMRLSDRGPEKTPAPNAEAVATASTRNPMTSPSLSAVEQIITDSSVQVDSTKIPDTTPGAHAETQQPIDTTIHSFITPLSQLEEAPYICLLDKETTKIPLTSGHSGSLYTSGVAPSELQETAAPWQHVSAGWFPGIREYCDPAPYAASFNNLLSAGNGKAPSVASETLKHLHRLNSEVRI